VHQLRKHYPQLIAVCLVVAGLGVLSTQMGHEADYGPTGRLVVELFSPIQQTVTAGGQGVSNLWSGYLNLVGVEAENRRLKENVRRLRSEVIGLREDRLANERLKRLLGLKESAGLPLLPAQVVGKSATPWFRTLMIDRGTRDGVQRGMAVVVPEGIVGRVISASAGYSKVLLANDRNSAVDAILQRTRARGIFEGEGGGMCRLKYVPRGEEVRPGDLVISSGLGQVFPKGLPLGVVEEVACERAGVFQYVKVRPTVDFGSLEEVAVVTAGPPGPS
jgi:rod shape-determining protein MreC